MAGPAQWVKHRVLDNMQGGLLIVSAAVLVFLGFLVLSSIAQVPGAAGKSLLMKQGIWLVLSVTAAYGVYRVDLEKVGEYAPMILFFAVVVLMLVLVPGVGIKVNGARRWMQLGPMRLQVAEFAKLALIIFLARYYAVNQRELRSFTKGFMIPSVVIGLVAGLILLQPDFGTAFLCGGVGLVILFLVGVPLGFLLPSLLCAGSLFLTAVMYDPVRLKRLTSFMDVEANRMDGAYQLWQGMLAFSAGKWSGLGLGNGRQQWFFLPEAHTDFIFPVLAEELGLVASLGVLGLFMVVFTVGYLSLKQMPNLFYYVVASGALFTLVFQALINMGVVTGLLPTKGMSLPFVSYGGSNLMLVLVLVGVLLNCRRVATRTEIFKPSEL